MRRFPVFPIRCDAIPRNELTPDGIELAASRVQRRHSSSSLRRHLDSRSWSQINAARAKDHAGRNAEVRPYYCADYKCGTQSWSTPAAGAMTCACSIWSRDLPVRFAAIGGPTSGRCSSTRAWGPVSLRQGDGLMACGTSRPGAPRARLPGLA